MQAEVHINGRVAFIENVTGDEANLTAYRLRDWYRIDTLSACGVEAFVCISNVESRMNSESFIVKPEAYDELYFTPTGL